MSTSRLWPFVGIAALSGAAGFAAAASLLSSDASTVRADAMAQQADRIEQALRKLETCPAEAEAPPPRATVTVDTSGLRAEIRQLIQEELRNAAASVPTSSLPPARAPEPDAQQVAAFSQGRRLVENAVALGRWSEAQRQELRVLLPQFTSEQREDVFRTLIVGINSGKVKVETAGAPF